MSSLTQDPFPAVQQDVRTAWANLSSTLTHLSPQLLEERLTSLERDLRDLSQAVEITRHNRARFRISDHELAQREKFINDMHHNITSLRRKSSAREWRPERREEVIRANDAFVNDEVRQQELIMEQQDEHLDHLASAVERIGVMGRDMHTELETQGQMLDGLDNEFGDARSRMRRVHQKLDRFIEETGPKQFCTIVTLVITFIVLTFLVATT